MRKIPLLLLLILACVVSAPAIHADTFTNGTLNFAVVTGSGPTPTGSFVFDNTTSVFNSFTVQWNGQTFDFATAGITLANLGTSGNWCAATQADLQGPCLSIFPSPSVFFLECSPGTFPLDCSNGFKEQDGISGTVGSTPITNTTLGTYTITETSSAVPEPTSLLLLASGLAALPFLKRRR